MAIETEKKYRLDKKRLVEITAKLGELGAEFSEETFEENYLHRGGVLDEKNAMLRLRKVGGRALLTYKEKVKNEDDIRQKIEHETEVVDVDEIENIIDKLGYHLSIVYEKHRKAWHFGDVEVVLDELPFGLYMEIEGEINDLLKAEKMLEIKDLETEPRGYPSLTARFGKTKKDGVVEARFEKFKSV